MARILESIALKKKIPIDFKKKRVKLDEIKMLND